MTECEYRAGCTSWQHMTGEQRRYCPVMKEDCPLRVHLLTYDKIDPMEAVRLPEHAQALDEWGDEF